MNLKILQWLIAHRELLVKVLEVVKGFNKNLPAIEQWAIIDKVARLIIPALTEADLKALYAYELLDHEEVEAYALGNEYVALGFDWSFVVTVLVPILRIILAALETFHPDE